MSIHFYHRDTEGTESIWTQINADYAENIYKEARNAGAAFGSPGFLIENYFQAVELVTTLETVSHLERSY